jgi:hypothetical protein
MGDAAHPDELAALRRRAEIAERYAAVLADGLLLADADIGSLRAGRVELEQQLLERDALLAQRDQALADVTSSPSWRLTAPLRALRRRPR